jgi:toxin-antitoxin system, antitoxin component, hicB family
MGYLKYKGYTGSVEYSPEDGCLFGKVQGLHGTLISYEGESVEEIRQDFEGAVDDYLISCKERGIEPAKPYSGKLNLRMSSDLHAAIAKAASSSGTTINDFINRSMSRVVHLQPPY